MQVVRKYKEEYPFPKFFNGFDESTDLEQKVLDRVAGSNISEIFNVSEILSTVTPEMVGALSSRLKRCFEAALDADNLPVSSH